MMLRRAVAVVALASGIYAALPAIEWCPFTWLECAEAAGDGFACGSPKPGASCTLPCDPVADPLPFGDRAWCIHPVLEAVAVRATDAPLPVVLPGVLPARPEEPVPAAAALATPDREMLPPVLIAPHAPPLSRAPPRA